MDDDDAIGGMIATSLSPLIFSFLPRRRLNKVPYD